MVPDVDLQANIDAEIAACKTILATMQGTLDLLGKI